MQKHLSLLADVRGCTAIRRIDTEQRGTKLAQRIREFSK